MEHNRQEEYYESLKEFSTYPEELNQLDVRLNHKHKTIIKKKLIAGFGSISLVFFLFVVIVNTPTALADAILRMPVIGTLADYVSYDKGLENAVKNKYAQEINIIEENNGYTLGIPYVIADDKRLMIFFKLSEDLINQDGVRYYLTINKIVNSSTGKKYENYSTNSSDFDPNHKKKDNLSYSSIRSVKEPIPENLDVYVTLNKETFLYENGLTQVDSSNLFEPETNNNNEKLGEFKFELHLNPFPEPKTYILNQDIHIMEQTLHLNSVTEYPTGTEVSITIPENNTCIMNGLELKAIDTKGKEWGNPGGVISMGPDEENRILYYLEGDYFSTAELEKIWITGIRLIDKKEAKITVDLQNKTIAPALSDITLKEVEKAGDKAYLTFESNSTDSMDIFKSSYTDTNGNDYYFDKQSYLSANDHIENYFAVVWPENNKIILTRSMSPIIFLEDPVEINLKQKNKD